MTSYGCPYISWLPRTPSRGTRGSRTRVAASSFAVKIGSSSMLSPASRMTSAFCAAAVAKIFSSRELRVNNPVCKSEISAIRIGGAPFATIGTRSIRSGTSAFQTPVISAKIVDQRNSGDGHRANVANGTRFLNGSHAIANSSANVAYRIAKHVHANHGGPKRARTNREKSVRALRIGKNTHITFPTTISANTTHRRRGCTRMSTRNVATFATRKIATAIAMKTAVIGRALSSSRRRRDKLMPSFVRLQLLAQRIDTDFCLLLPKKGRLEDFRRQDKDLRRHLRIVNLCRKAHKNDVVVFATMNLFHMPPPATGERLYLRGDHGLIIDDDDIHVCRLPGRKRRLRAEAMECG